MRHEQAIREEIVRIATRCYDRGLLVAGDGNISVDLEGRPLESSEYKVSSEWPMHRVIYEARPDIQAVVHAHPPHATAFAVAGLSLEKAILSEVVLTLGCVPLASYGTPSTRELTDAIEPFLAYHDALLMANHGAVAYADTLEKAFNKLETLEHTCKISFLARTLGNENVIPGRAIEKLFEIRERSGMMRPEARTGQACGLGGAADAISADRFELTREELYDLLSQVLRLVPQRQ